MNKMEAIKPQEGGYGDTAAQPIANKAEMGVMGRFFPAWTTALRTVFTLVLFEHVLTLYPSYHPPRAMSTNKNW